MRLMLAMAVGLLVAGCSVPRPVARAGCAYDATPLAVSPLDPHPLTAPAMVGVDGGGGAIAAPTALSPFAERIRLAAARQPTLESNNQPDDAYALLSGGSQHGAFGAGFFYGLSQQGHVPRYKIVTGVSTGALQSTFVFLANQRTGGGDYGWVNGPMKGLIPPGQSNLGDLALAYSIDRESDIIKPSAGGGIFGAIRSGSTDTFAPLRARLQSVLTPQLLGEVASEYDAGRSLFVAVADADDGIGYAIDLTRLAHRLVEPGANFSLIQGCYIDALLASSSVPPGVPPVSLALRHQSDAEADMAIDGGARDGVFVEEGLKGLAAAHESPRVTVIINGGLYQGAWQQNGQRVAKWSVLTIALRAVDMLENQVYRLSVARAEEFGAANGGLLTAFINTEGLAPGAEEPDAHIFAGKSCAAWSDIDAQQKVVEFHPHYMGCLIDYGVARGKGESGGRWNKDIPHPLVRRVDR